MATPIAPFKPANIVPKSVALADVSTTGVKLTYTVPAGRAAKLLFAGARLAAGAAPTIVLRWTSGAVVIDLLSLTVLAGNRLEQWLSAGDTLAWQVTIVGAAGTADLTMSLEEYEVQ